MDRLKRAIVIASTGIVLIAAGALARASIPDASGVIHACYKKGDGDLRVIDDAVSGCKLAETPLAWSQAGPQGAPGVSGYEVVTETFIAGQGTGGGDVECPRGKRVLGGGVSVTPPPAAAQFEVSTSVPTPDGTGWTMAWAGDGGGSALEVRVVCALVS